MTRLQVLISPEHNSAALCITDTDLVLEIPIESWEVNGHLSLNIPWSIVDLAITHDYEGDIEKQAPAFFNRRRKDAESNTNG